MSHNVSSKNPRTEQFARWISRIGHPFVLPLVALLAVTRSVLPLPQAVGIVALAAVTITVPLLVVTRRQIRGRQWTDYDVSVREHRHGLYPVILATLLVSMLSFWLLDGPAFMLRGLAACMVLTVVAMLVNFVSKISLHAALSTFCAIALLALQPWLGLAACVFAALIAWSRIVLRRHTPFEVVCGVLLGATVGTTLVWIG
jgi:membrane-associated phospholipid phosphatase